MTAASKAAAEFYQSLTSATEDSFSASSSSGWLAQGPDTNLITKYVDSEDICYIRDTASGRVGVRGGKPEALVSWLVNDISGPS
ncbi:hypothetical protein, partial [Vibrio alginolyticus]|uniref:hypothetical protein n=1 Tax=Vibrio alginolyticus TaxID=663 RepID=UPI001A8E8A3F